MSSSPKVNLRQPKILPCPFCGGEDFYVGPESCESSEVMCRRDDCRARIVRRFDEAGEPKGVWLKYLSFEQNSKRVYAYYARQAILAWNRRVS